MIYFSLDKNKESLEHLNRVVQFGVQGPVIERIESIVTQKADQEI